MRGENALHSNDRGEPNTKSGSLLKIEFVISLNFTLWHHWTQTDVFKSLFLLIIFHLHLMKVHLRLEYNRLKALIHKCRFINKNIFKSLLKSSFQIVLLIWQTSLTGILGSPSKRSSSLVKFYRTLITVLLVKKEIAKSIERGVPIMALGSLLEQFSTVFF